MSESILPPNKRVNVHGFALRDAKGVVVYCKTPVGERQRRRVGWLTTPNCRYVVRLARGKWVVIQPRWVTYDDQGIEVGGPMQVQVSPTLHSCTAAKAVAIMQARMDA